MPTDKLFRGPHMRALLIFPETPAIMPLHNRLCKLFLQIFSTGYFNGKWSRHARTGRPGGGCVAVDGLARVGWKSPAVSDQPNYRASDPQSRQRSRLSG